MRGAGVRSLFDPLRHRDFRLVASGSLVSLLGDGVFRVAIGLQVYAVEEDPRALGAVALVWTLAQVVLLPVGGWASDHLDRRTVLVAADVWRAAAIGALGVLSVTDRLSLGALLVIGACFGAGNAFFNPASISLMPDLVPEEDLPRANAFLGAARPTMLYIAGPLVGGLVIGLVGTGPAFLLDAATFLGSGALVALVTTRTRAQSTDGGFRAQLTEAGQGLRLVLRTRWLWLGMTVLAISALAFHGPFDVLLPFRLIRDFGLSEARAAFTIAGILAASGVGSVVTSAVIARRGLPRHFVRAYYVGEGLAMLSLVLIGVMNRVELALISGFVIGAMFALTEITWTTMLQRYVPREVLGRVSSLDWMVAIGLSPISFALAGSAGAAFGAGPVLVTAGLFGAVVLIGLSFVPGALEPEQRAAAAGPSIPVVPAAAPTSPLDPAPVTVRSEPALDPGSAP